MQFFHLFGQIFCTANFERWYTCERMKAASSMNYTEHQKKLIASFEWHSLKSTESKLIIFGNRGAIVLLIKHNLTNKKVACVIEDKHAVNFSNLKTLALHAYITHRWNSLYPRIHVVYKGVYRNQRVVGRSVGRAPILRRELLPQFLTNSHEI